MAEKERLNKMLKSNAIYIQLATYNDIPTLVIHHHKMFKQIWELRGLKTTAQKMEDMDKSYTEKLNKEMDVGQCVAWVVKDDKIVASGAVSFVSMVPIPNDSNSTVAYLHSLYTEHENRNKGYCRQIVMTAIDHCKSKGIKRMILNASEAGKSIYEDIGFRSADSSMRLMIE